MNTLAKSILAAVAAGGLLAGCATYDYGYGYSYNEPYYYGYDYGPYYYDYGPYYYGAPYYGPSVGFGFTYRDRDRGYRHERSERRRTSYNGTRYHGARDGRSTATRSNVTHSAARNAASPRSRPRSVAPARAQAHRGYAPNSLVQSEQQ